MKIKLYIKENKTYDNVEELSQLVSSICEYSINNYILTTEEPQILKSYTIEPDYINVEKSILRGIEVILTTTNDDDEENK